MFERIRTRQIEGKIRLQQAEIDLTNLSNTKPVTESGNFVLPEADEADWHLMGKTSEKGLDSTDQETLREQAQKTYYKNTHGRNIIRLFEKYVAGRGFNISPVSSMDAVVDYWKEFWRVNKMALRVKEIVRRGMRDGEDFLRYFEGEKEEMIKVRFMNPDFVQTPTDLKITDEMGNVNDGIETDKEDIENVLGYYYKGDRIPAKEVDHIKILVDSDILRGRSFYEPLLQGLAMYKKWLADRMKLNEQRTVIAVIKKVKGNPTDAANIATKYETSKLLNPDGTTKARAPKNVSVITTNKNVEYELKTPNLQASDVQHDGVALLRDVSAGSGLPEYMVTSDSSNSNYASTLVAEGPAVMEFEDWQDFFGEAFKVMFYRVIESGIRKGKIPKQETLTEQIVSPKGKLADKKITKDTSTECTITFPDLVARDVEKETKALILQRGQEWISDTSAQAKLDLDHDEERELLKKEKIENPEEDEEFKKDEEDLEIEKQKKKMEEE